MKNTNKLSKWCVALFLVVLGNIAVYAQENKTLIQSAFENEKSKQHWQSSDISEWKLNSQYRDESTGITHAYVQQSINGIPVYNAISVLAIKENKVAYFKPGLVSNATSKVNASKATLTPESAIASAAKHLELTMKIAPELVKQDATNNQYEFKAPELSRDPIKVQLVYFFKGEKLLLAYYVSINLKDGKHWWNVKIDATTGLYLNKNDYVKECGFGDKHSAKAKSKAISKYISMAPAATVTGPSYNVYPFPVEAPNFGSRSLLSNPADPTASPFGWHDTNGAAGAEFTITRGNNVYAYEDHDNDNAPGYSPDGGANLEFDFPVYLSSHPDSSVDAALTNLFYSVNAIHDKLYTLGFNEAAGNFQTNNYGNGGTGNDPVLAEGFDGGGTNNANFATPPDGSNGRMQMYLWSSGNCGSLTITSGGFNGTMNALSGSFSPVANVTANVILMDDGVAPITDGCSAPVNSVAGKIVLIDRGSCFFQSKVEAAQAAGAVGVIIANNNAGAIFSMGGNGNPPTTIPAVMISQADGNILKAELLSGTVSANLVVCVPPVYDGSLDNGIIAHEFGHGVSNRLTGGPANAGCLGNGEQGGEGWSDWLALMMTIEPGDSGTNARQIGSYVSSGGIRTYPYSTDMNINPHTYADLAVNPEVHYIGEIWCSAIWDMSWFLINQYGYDSSPANATAGNNIAIKLVLEGMKLQPCGPGFLDARDAILLADHLLYNDAHACLIWQAFARRGMGVYADEGDADIAGDETEDFTIGFCSACTGTPNAGVTVSNTSEVCSLGNFTLHLSGASADSGLTYQWQISPDSIVWTNLGSPSTINTPYTGTQTAANYYRCIVTCTLSSLSDSSDIVFVGFVTDCIFMSTQITTTCSANFYDSGGPSANYSDNENFLVQTFLPATAGNRIQLSWDYFHSELGYDYIVIFDGPDASYPVLYADWGDLSIPTFTSSDATGALSVMFYSDEGVTRSGWKAHVSCVPCVAPATPGVISGPAKVCRNQTGFVYTVDPVAGAGSYQWTLPAGMAPASGGLITATNSITVTTNNTFNSGNITVRGIGCGGNGPFSAAFAVSRYTAKPSAPTLINSLSGVVYGYCAGNTYTFSSSSNANADYFTWAASSGTVLSGQGTNTVSVQLNSPYTSCLITVSASNCLGTTSLKKLTLRAVLPKPTITGVTSVCKNISPVQTYTVSSAFSPTSYTWSSSTPTIMFSDGGAASNPLTTTITTVSVNYTAVPNGLRNVRAAANNACGSGPYVNMSLYVSTCGRIGTAESTDNSENTLTVFPNPTHDMVNVYFASAAEGTYSVRLMDVTGRVIMTENKNSVEGENEYLCNLEKVSPGIYLITVQQGGTILHSRIVKE